MGPWRSLQDVVHEEKRLYLVFEFLDVDLKEHMVSNPACYTDPLVIKVNVVWGLGLSGCPAATRPNP